jgi:hypothetical protein
MYGGGMGELGVGRGQIELLAALFHADAPNDVAPSAYNEEDPPGDLPASPLTPRPEARGVHNSVRPAESATLQGESSSRTAVPPRRSHTRRRPPCLREISLSTQVRKRVRLGQK